MDDLSFFEAKVQNNISTWLNGPYDEMTKNEIRKLLKNNPPALLDAFSENLSFGTGGVRAIMGIGTNRLNIYTIAVAMQGLANFLKKQKNNASVLIGYDGRNNSRTFAEQCAKVLVANKIKVFIFKELRPTPLVSFGCRVKKCAAAIMITASHNPPKYNGFKIYGSDGGQIVSPQDKVLISEMEKVGSFSNVNLLTTLDNPLIEWIDKEMDELYLQQLKTLNNYPQENKTDGKKLHIVYTNLHGTGITILPQALKDWGFTNISLVEQQVPIDGNFSAASSPNPEEKEALKLGIELLLKKRADILIATDPDADRVGVVVNHKGQAIILSGNQVAALLAYHLCDTLSQQKKLPKNGALIKTIVTTELFREIAKYYKMASIDVLTGFKYIAEKINLWEQDKKLQFVFGAEESCGYLTGTFVRDKDAISISALIAEMALRAKQQGKSLIDLLYVLYAKFGIFREKLLSLSFTEGAESLQKMQKAMGKLRKNPPKLIANYAIATIEDYQAGTILDFASGKTSTLDLPKSDVLRFFLKDNSKIVIRPSGTEPKMKVYVGVMEKSFTSIDEGIAKCDARLEALASSVKAML